MLHDGAHHQHHQNQRHYADLKPKINVTEHRCCVVLAVLCLFDQALGAGRNIVVDVLPQRLVLVVANQLLCLADLLAVGHPLVALVQRHRPDGLRPAFLVRNVGLGRQPHGITVGIAQIFGAVQRSFQ